ncbi:MAG: NAD-dependent epimerase/dehydratase family protein [Candidatus Hermodarchaeota archaeon]
MTILITGGTGLVGKALVQYLLNETAHGSVPSKIRLLVRKRQGDIQRKQFLTKCSKKGVDIFWGDLRKLDDVLTFTKVSDPNVSILIHCGAIFNFWQPYELLYDVNVLGTEKILLGFHRNQIKKLIHLSSVAVYGQINGTNGHGVTEDQPINFNSSKNYELTKALGEERVRKYQETHPKKLITILRPSGIIGGSGTTLDVFSRMFLSRFVPLPRGGKDKISLVDVDDVARAIVFFSDFNIGNGEAYNLVSFTPTLRQMALELSRALQRKHLTILSIPLLVFKPMYYFTRVIRKIKKPKEQSLLIPILFDKLGQDVWIDDSKLRTTGFLTNSTLTKSMARFGKFLSENPWYSREKFHLVL